MADPLSCSNRRHDEGKLVEARSKVDDARIAVTERANAATMCDGREPLGLCRRRFVRDIATDADDAITVSALRCPLAQLFASAVKSRDSRGLGYVGYRTDRAWHCD